MEGIDKSNEGAEQKSDFWNSLEKDIRRFRNDIAAVDYKGIGDQIYAESNDIGKKAVEKVKEFCANLQKSEVSVISSNESQNDGLNSNRDDSDEDIIENEEIEQWDADDEDEEVETWEYQGQILEIDTQDILLLTYIFIFSGKIH